MIIDSSALIAILKDEPERARFLARISSAAVTRISAPTLVETRLVIRSSNADARELLAAHDVETVAFTAEDALIADDAARRFRKGGGRVGLNLGDLFALARRTGEPLLFKGDDFVQADVTSAM